MSHPSAHLRGLEREDLPTGARYLKLHHYGDPAKDDKWLAQVEKEMADTPTEFRREILLDEDVHDGTPVFQTYNDKIHVFRKNGVNAEIPIIPGSAYVGGWDAGQALTPAFTLAQIAPFSDFVHQVHVLMEVTSRGGESMEEFAPRVVQALLEVLPGTWDEVIHVGDATVVTRNGTNKKTAQQEAKRHGIHIKPMSNVWAPRQSAVSRLLASRITDDIPGLLIDATRCPFLHKGFQGAYKWKTQDGLDATGPQAVVMMPVKNMFSHVHDSLQMSALQIRSMTEGGGARVVR